MLPCLTVGQLLNQGFCFRQPELHQGAGQKRRRNGADAHNAAQDKAYDDKENIASHAYKTELDPLQLIGNDDSDQIVGARSRLAVDDDGHTQGQDDTAKEHDRHPYVHGTGFITKRSDEPVEKIDNGTAAKGADNRSRLDIALCGKKHDCHDQAQNRNVDGADAGKRGAGHFLKGQGQSLNKNSKGIGAQCGCQKHGNA